MTNPTPERQNHAESVVIYPIGNISSTPEKQNLAEPVAVYRFFQVNFFYGKESSKKASFQVLIRTKIWGL